MERATLVGIEILKIDTRVVIASVDTYLRFADRCNRLDLEAGPHKPAELTDAADTVSSALEQPRTEEREPQGQRAAHREDESGPR
ncbi:hypothetical protein [Streptomyces collinus]|uniref:hypothetical protein n=1 Tax=Streptomyces collinus TaxID=42684 RepID=UPI0036350A2F